METESAAARGTAVQLPAAGDHGETETGDHGTRQQDGKSGRDAMAVQHTAGDHEDEPEEHHAQLDHQPLTEPPGEGRVPQAARLAPVVQLP
ncbi:hypothetical protein OH768_42245 [Streptomyces sp. NBC_01622]|nr:hypothetical protein OH768_42245 [Streptomyces sp. NBC_01622]